ncbi:hypothetical protein [Paracidovorax citrulli]|uniref:hypothetical protein n=1 Tax=Paracidovorax citrulli TaxID=80869 RepID=UPI000AB82417
MGEILRQLVIDGRPHAGTPGGVAGPAGGSPPARARGPRAPAITCEILRQLVIDGRSHAGTPGAAKPACRPTATSPSAFGHLVPGPGPWAGLAGMPR